MSFQKRLSSGEFVVLAEMNTPKGVDTSQFVADARRIKGRVDAVIVPDMDNGVMRMSALAGGVLMHQLGLESIIHVYCRDRNRMALQGDLLAAYALGIQNIVVVCGEDMKNADHHNAKPVNDLSELELLGAIRTLEAGSDLSGIELNGAPQFTTGCTMAPWRDEKGFEQELELTGRKVKAGAEFVVTPPVFDLQRFVPFAEQTRQLGIPVIPTVFLIKSVGVARYIATNEPAAGMTEEIIQRIRKASDREMECVRIAAEAISAIKESVQGVRLVTLGWEHRLPAILDLAGL
ncbi:methylenetetrahydrofolate reductase [Desulfoferrobacter suflitae]|uniref:methylenetetrahydrofolate reductase n=1 Tax=Desulfoferrobacter suflitae TaxID=2865782 RepID=UPI00216498D2|nr:methylenetetrahydrofolate reductase [Desulfoferrobacter suflitae]MCK8603621.1 methylenetetrahydrofolate reductase [Desulfoferrobacter suflitae]